MPATPPAAMGENRFDGGTYFSKEALPEDTGSAFDSPSGWPRFAYCFWVQKLSFLRAIAPRYPSRHPETHKKSRGDRFWAVTPLNW
jgi:hypothetical protein